jgi:hypothetical protein
MLKHICKVIAVLAFTVVIPTVIAMIYQTIDRDIGWLIVTFTAAAGTMALIAANWPWRRLPNYDAWDEQNRFRLWEVACLMADQQPSKPLGFLPRWNLRALQKAIRAYKLVVRHDDFREVIVDAYYLAEANPEWTVSREALMIYLQSIGLKPPFLFPKERK